MRKYLVPLPFVIFCSVLPVRTAEPSPRSSIEAKLALEASLEKRVQMVLSEALGTGDVIVIISAELQEEKKKQALDFLPGIPEKEKVGEISLSSSLTMVKKISATLILDRNLPAGDLALAKKLAAGLLGLPPEREDLVMVEKMDFRKAKPLSLADILMPPNIWNLVWILLAAILGALTIFTFFRPFSLNVRELVAALGAKTGGDQSQERGPEKLQTGEAAVAAADKGAPSADTDRKTPFWFLTGADTANLAFILKGRPAEDLTIIMSYLPDAAAASLAEALYPRSIEALASLPKTTLMPEARIKTLEAEIRAALDFVVGSESKTMEIIEQLPDNMQNAAMLSFSSRNPAFSGRLSAAIVRFADLKLLEPAQAQMLARRLPMRNLALALKNSDLSQSFMDKLSPGMQERFRQELDLTRNPLPEAQREERVRVARELKKLIRDGFISIPRSLPSAAGAPAPKPADAPAAPPPPAGKPAAPATDAPAPPKAP